MISFESRPNGQNRKLKKKLKLLDFKYKKSEFQVLSFNFIVNIRRCPLSFKLTSLVLNHVMSFSLNPVRFFC
ncbi:hypothetical protein HanXRQr2_Chr17g0828091 [Helianthus annuus]|uniref:Uncharacterized protein n=1 Tax=Helianthus annuus TaxID=4232 RepID=A0A9K3DP15_HELAN|nr:hypothetical protein HanXRQr2_Chr17g0828091 [Helianthus annuus]